MKFMILVLVTFLSSYLFAQDRGVISCSSFSSSCCVKDSEELKCWGYKGVGKEREQTYPQFSSEPPSVGPLHTCAVEYKKVKCEGYNYYGQTEVPRLKNPRAVSTGSNHSCALDDKGVKCWGDNRSGQTKVPSLKKPTLISSGAGHICVLDNEEVKCWGDNSYGQTRVPSLKKPRVVSCGAYHSCALDDEGVKCWGSNGSGQRNVPVLYNPREISSGSAHVCALDDEGVKCWGNNYYGQTIVPKLNFGPTLKAPSFSLKEMELFLKVVGQGSSPVRLKFFSGLLALVSSRLTLEGSTTMEKFIQSSARYTLAALLSPGILSGDSQYYLEKVIPAYKESMKKIEIELGLFGLNDVLDMPLNRTVALSVIQSTLSVMNEFFSASDRSELLSVNRLLGSALADVTSREKVLAAVDEIEAKKEIFQKLERSSKTSFLVETLFTAREFLDSKVR